MTIFYRIIFCGVVLACATCSTDGIALEEKVHQLEKHFIEAKGVLEAKIAQLESKVSLLEAKVEQHSLLNERENQTFSEAEVTQGETTEHRTCFELKKANLSSGMHLIDPDGEDSGDGPILVYCDFAKGSTSVLHDSESTIYVTKCYTPGCYSRPINYNASEKQVAALAELSSECHQSIRYNCNNAQLHFNGVHYSWWNDRNGNRQYFWSGNKTDAHTCQCGIDGNCEDPYFKCNCDSLNKIPLADSGIITDKEILPVTRLNFGRTLLISSSGAHTLGRFECSGQSTLKEKPPNPMPTSCEDLQKIGHTLNGIYSVMKNKKVKTIYCEFERRQLEQHFIEAKGILEAKVAQLESKINLFEANVEPNLFIDTQGDTTNHSRTCYELKTANPLLSSGMHLIDPDGEDSGDGPILVYCDFATDSTSILHDSESTINVTKCYTPGCYSRQINYNASENQIAALAELSSECHQSIRFNCENAQLYTNGVHTSWWNDKNGNRQYFWSGNKTDIHTCQCGIDKTCFNKELLCNCDITGTKRKLRDIGIITDKELLPVTRLNFGTIQIQFYSGAHTLGRLECSGQSTLKEKPFNPMPTSCEDLRKIGHTLNGIYSVMKNDIVKTIYCDFMRPHTGKQETELPSAQTGVSVRYLQSGLNEIKKRFAEYVERFNESVAPIKELNTNLTETAIALIGIKDSVRQLEDKLTEDIRQLRQESTETSKCCTRKSDDILKEVNGTLHSLFETKEELLIKALQNIQTSENVITTRISELATQFNELESTVEDKFKSTTIELTKTRTELSSTEATVNDLMAKFNAIVNQERTSDTVGTDIGVMPSSCSDLQKMGHKISGVYLVTEKTRIKTVYCNFIPSNGTRLETVIGYADVKSNPTYFYVQRRADYFNQTNVPVPFDVQQLNVGEAMNLKTGKFTAPVPGRYYFSASGTCFLDKSTNWNKIDIFLYKNANKIGTARSDSNNNDYQYETFVIQSTLNLLKGDQSWLELFYISPGAKLYGRYSTHFTGFLLEEDMSL